MESASTEQTTVKTETYHARNRVWLIIYDLLIFLAVDVFLYILYQGGGRLDARGVLCHSIAAAILLFGVRILLKVYSQVWRYGGIQCYIRLLLADAAAFLIYLIVNYFPGFPGITFAKVLSFCALNTIFGLTIRMVYRYAYKCGGRDDVIGRLMRWLLKVFAHGRVSTEPEEGPEKINVAIIGAGNVGASLAEEMVMNPRTVYVPRCFIDNDADKIGRNVRGIAVYSESEATFAKLKEHKIQEVIFTVPQMNLARRHELYTYYKEAGFRVKTYDYPSMDIPGSKRQMREFNIEDLLFRTEKDVVDDKTIAYYKDKVILITGGGGSIGSELLRQLSQMGPKQLIIVDIYENSSYTLQQDLLFRYRKAVDVRVEIVSITNRSGLRRVFAEYHPDIVINAAAHKHVPLMEKNCIEAVENNVFGTLNVIQCCEEYGCGRFMMVSTDKAVNPTNVMGATKRMCEMIMQAYSTRGKVKCSATRFGNVLGSAGSVIPIFKRQIAEGGPVTITDYRIVRYFMTIPEAAQLVLQSGAMAQNADLFVLDMGKPVRIYDLARNMIELSGASNIEIIETGLRPGEKLYEELLVKKDNVDKTENDQIFIEHETPVTMEELDEKLSILRAACAEAGEDPAADERVKEALHRVVPTYHTPEEVNKEAEVKLEKLK